MAEITTLNYPQHDRDFRRGYSRGAQSVIQAIGPRLPDHERQLLQLWVANELTQWANALDRSDFLPPELPKM